MGFMDFECRKCGYVASTEERERTPFCPKCGSYMMLKREAAPGIGLGVKESLRSYVMAILRQGTVDLSFRKDEALPPIPIDPFCVAPLERKRCAHWLLLNASIDQGELVGPAINARALLSSCYGTLKEGIFEVEDSEVFNRVIEGEAVKLGRSGKIVPRILVSVNAFVRREAAGDIYRWGINQRKAADIVERIANGVYFMGKDFSSTPRKKAWMYMRWMVRPKPDTGIWGHLGTKELLIPLDSNVAKVALKFGALMDSEAGGAAMGRREVMKMTAFARELFPEDPACVDYPFFLLGTNQHEGDRAKIVFNELMAPHGIRW